MSRTLSIHLDIVVLVLVSSAVSTIKKGGELIFCLSFPPLDIRLAALALASDAFNAPFRCAPAPAVTSIGGPFDLGSVDDGGGGPRAFGARQAITSLI